jgi:hypothetical protein
MKPYEIIRKSRLDVHPFDYAPTCPYGLIMEFGVADGTSLKELAKRVPKRTVYGFDTFFGLPEPWGKLHGIGGFTQGGIIPEGLPSNVEIIQGLFQDTLPDFLKIHTDKVAFAHIDSDIYSAAVCILTNIENQLQVGTILAFDELLDYADLDEGDPGHWHYHEYKAFCEFLERTGVGWKCLSRCGAHQVVIQITSLGTEESR